MFKAGGTYRLDKALRVGGRTGLTLDGNGATLRAKDDGLVVEQFSEDTTIRDLRLNGGYALGGTSDACCSSAKQHGISVWGSTNTLIEGVDIRRFGGDCLYISGHEGRIWADGVTFRDSECRLNGRTGVVIIAGSDVRVVNNTFDQIGYSVVGIEPNQGYQGARGVVMRGNTIGSYGLMDWLKSKIFYAENAPWSDGATVKDVTITGNTVAGNPGGYDGVMLGLNIKVVADVSPTNYTITNNTAAKAVPGPVMKILGVNGVTITGNKQPLSSGKLANLSGSTNVTYDG